MSMMDAARFATLRRMAHLSWLVLLVGLSFWSAPVAAQTYGNCTVAGAAVSLGSQGSYTVASQNIPGSGASGLSCTSLLTLATTSYIKVKIESSTFQLTGPTGQTIPFTLSSTSGGAAVPVGTEINFTTTTLLNLFTGPNSSIPLYFSATKTTGLAAGTYTGTVNLRWYFSVCKTGALGVCLTSSDSPGANPPSDWGTGVPVAISVTLNVQNDCQITAPDLAFGAAPLVGSFSVVTRTISVRCSLGAAYTVGLDNGQNFSSTRRMRQGSTSSYLSYEIYRGSSISNGRWGSAIAGERRSSANADTNPGIHDASTLQGFTYSANINPAQATPAAGSYTDIIIIDIAF